MLYKDSDNQLVSCLKGWGHAIPDLQVLDIGVSGGFYPIWRHWGEAFRGVGFDPVSQVTAGLTEAEASPFVKYENLWVTSPDKLSPTKTTKENDTPSDYMLHRTSGYAVTEMFEKCSSGLEYVADRQLPIDTSFSNFENPLVDPYNHHHSVRMNNGEEPQFATKRMTLDAYFNSKLATPTVLKIDTDGQDFDILRGAEQLLQTNQILFVEIECQFHGTFEKDSNTFSNIDGFLRSHGYSLIKLNPYRHSKRALPFPFECEIAAQSTDGALKWCDALYVKDPIPPLLQGEASNISSDLLLQYALIYDVYGLYDCAAEIFIEGSKRVHIETRLRTRALNHLTNKVTGRDVSYTDYITAFERDPFDTAR